VLASLPCTRAGLQLAVGSEAYSYRYVFQAFAPLLTQWGSVAEVTRPESRLDFAVWQAHHERPEALHLSFLPLHLAYLTGRAPNVGLPNWEFPDIPSTDLGGNPRNNWARLAEHYTLLIAHCQSTRKAFMKAGVRTPIHWVPVPVEAEYFRLPLWRPQQSVELACPAIVFPQAEVAPDLASSDSLRESLTLRQRVRGFYRDWVRPSLPARARGMIARAARGARITPPPDALDLPYRIEPALKLSGVVYTTFLNPFDPRKNWQDLLTGFLLALGERADATLVVKLVLRPELLARGLGDVIGYYRGLGVAHRCKLAFVFSYLDEATLHSLAQASTFYLNTSRAEGSCLPLQNFLAAGRPAVAPVHSGLADYFDDPLGFIVQSQPEPTAFPHDPDKRLTTEWHRLVWTSLRDQIRASCEVACEDVGQYHAMARRARASLAAYASADVVRPRLERALSEACCLHGALSSGSVQSA
jgi:glycosyltransferase involved in cell wall biosynthesis